MTDIRVFTEQEYKNYVRGDIPEFLVFTDFSQEDLTKLLPNVFSLSFEEAVGVFGKLKSLELDTRQPYCVSMGNRDKIVFFMYCKRQPDIEVDLKKSLYRDTNPIYAPKI